MANLERLGGGFAFLPLYEIPQNRNQTIKTAKKIKQSIPLCYPTIPSHSKNKSKQSKSRDNPGKYSTLRGDRVRVRHAVIPRAVTA
jgi:hypothetical protein